MHIQHSASDDSGISISERTVLWEAKHEWLHPGYILKTREVGV